jgi:hypothetical protein
MEGVPHEANAPRPRRRRHCDRSQRRACTARSRKNDGERSSADGVVQELHRVEQGDSKDPPTPSTARACMGLRRVETGAIL